MDDLSRRRWKTVTKPDAHPPRRALEAALADLDDDSLEAKHIIVAIARPNDEGDDRQSTVFYQSGSLDAYAQVGLLAHVIKLMQDE